jgi:hypothetical protein
MNQRSEPAHEPEERARARLLDVLIRAGLILALVLLCYRIFASDRPRVTLERGCGVQCCR